MERGGAKLSDKMVLFFASNFANQGKYVNANTIILNNKFLHAEKRMVGSGEEIEDMLSLYTPE